MDRVTVTEVIEVDEDRVLFAGTRESDNGQVTFHMRAPGAFTIVARIDAGLVTKVDIP